jgi:hypothetical protein
MPRDASADHANREPSPDVATADAGEPQNDSRASEAADSRAPDARPDGGDPTSMQQRFVDWRFGMFLHFGMNTFSNCVWRSPRPPPAWSR